MPTHFATKCALPTPPPESSVHLRLRIGGKASDFGRVKFIKALAEYANLDELHVHTKLPIPEPQAQPGRDTFALDVTASATDDDEGGAALEAAKAVAVEALAEDAEVEAVVRGGDGARV